MANRKQTYEQEAYEYYNQLLGRLAALPASRSLVIRAGTLAALGGASALSSLLAACARGTVERDAATETGEARLAWLHPYAQKYHWRNLPWPTEPYYDGTLMPTSITGVSSFELATMPQSSGGCFWDQLTHSRYGAGADMDFLEQVPALAERVTPAPDFSYYDYHIRRNAYFHDFPPVNGRQCTAEDVKYSLDVYRTTGVLTATLEVIERVEVLDRFTVRVHLKRPVLWLNTLLGHPNYHIFAREHYEGDQDRWKQQPIGTGPMMVVSNRFRDHTTAVRNPRWSYTDERWPGARLPFLKGFHGIYVADAAASKSAFRTFQRDFFSAADPNEIDEILSTNPDSILQVLVPVSPYGAAVAIHLNMDAPLFKDVRVRRALSMALDRKAMMDLTAGGLAIAGHPISWNLMGYQEPLRIEDLGPYYQYNPTEAKRLLEEAGYKDGFEVEFVTTSPVADHDELTAKYWEAIGVRVKWNTQETTVVTATRLQRRHKHMIPGVYPTALLGVKLAREYYAPDSGLNYSRVNDPVLTEIIDKATYTLDGDEYIRLLRQINQYVIDQAYDIWRFATTYNEFRQPWVQNFANATSGWGQFFGNWQFGIVWVDDKAPGDRAGRRAV